MVHKDAQTIQNTLTNALVTRPLLLMGCMRQNVLQQGTDNEATWRVVRGNALLHHLGWKLAVTYPLGVFDVYVSGAQDGIGVLQFRGGRWKPWWVEDAQMVAACVDVYTTYTVDGILLLHEDSGTLAVNSIDPPANPVELVNNALQACHFTPTTRIRRNSRRGRAWCQHCTVRSSCELMDLEYGDTSDWLHQLKAR